MGEPPERSIEELFRIVADQDFAGYCPIYERIARAMADDPATCTLVLDDRPRTGRTPVLFFAATHDLILRNPHSDLAGIYLGETGDPWPEFRSLVHRHHEEIRHLMRTRTTQTNEVGRSAMLHPAIVQAAAAAESIPLALIEIGPSAGLNLLFDRYHLRYRSPDGRTIEVGDRRSPVSVDCELRGPCEVPVPSELPPIAARTGIDPAPVDLTNDADRRWLRACVWPGQPERARRLAAAIELVAADPPPLVTGDASTDLDALVAAVPDGIQPVIIATWALAYLRAEDRRTLLARIDELGARRNLSLVTGEDPKATPWVPAVPDAVLAEAHGDGTPTVLGLRRWVDGRCTTRALALCHPHGRWMHWLEELDNG